MQSVSPLSCAQVTRKNGAMARRRWIADEWSGTTAALLGAQALHLARVLRGTPGTRYEVVAGEHVWTATIARVTEERVDFLLESELPMEAALPLTLLMAVFKFDRLEWAIEKATELGVSRMVPVIAQRTEKHLAQAAPARVERWRRIAGEAARQSRRVDVPVVADPISLQKALAEPCTGSKFLLAENERIVLMRDALLSADGSGISVAVGPEGGWTSEEEQVFAKSSWQAVSLGPRILRAETAVIAGIALAASTLLG